MDLEPEPESMEPMVFARADIIKCVAGARAEIYIFKTDASRTGHGCFLNNNNNNNSNNNYNNNNNVARRILCL